MNNPSQPIKDVIIKITETESKYFVSIIPFNQVKQVFCHNEKTGVYQLIVKFLLGYFAGLSDCIAIDINKLNKIINNMNELFKINITLSAD